MIVYNWCGGKHLLIDVAVINPLCVSHKSTLIEEGVGGPATAYEKHKLNSYPEIDYSSYDFVPFIVESCGGVGQAALTFCKELEKRREAKEYWENKGVDRIETRKFPNPLLTAINLEVQRFNSRMILERQPPHINLIDSAFIKCQVEVAKKKTKAVKRLNRNMILVTEQNLKAACSGATAMIQYSPSVPMKARANKTPPDPPDHTGNEITSSSFQVHSTVSVVEHPSAIIHKQNSQRVSASTETESKISKERKKDVAKVALNHVLRKKNKNLKDSMAIDWEPPERTKRSRS